jgi:hypothetical protein
LLNEVGEDVGRDEAHEEERLEDGIAELRCLLEKSDRASRLLLRECLHLTEDVQELC